MTLPAGAASYSGTIKNLGVVNGFVTGDTTVYAKGLEIYTITAIEAEHGWQTGPVLDGLSAGTTYTVRVRQLAAVLTALRKRTSRPRRKTVLPFSSPVRAW